MRSDSGTGEAYSDDEEFTAGWTLLIVDIERANEELRRSCVCFDVSAIEMVGGVAARETPLDKDRRLSAALGSNCRDDEAMLRLEIDRAAAIAIADEVEENFMLCMQLLQRLLRTGQRVTR